MVTYRKYSDNPFFELDRFTHSLKMIDDNWKLARDFGLGSEKEWHIDQDSGVFTASFENGCNIKGKFQVIGSWSRESKTWLWGASNPSIDDSLKTIAFKLLEYGQKNSIPEMTESDQIKTSVNFIVDILPIVYEVSEAQGFYKAMHDGGFLILALNELNIFKDEAPIDSFWEACKSFQEISEDGALKLVKDYYGEIKALDNEYTSRQEKLSRDDKNEKNRLLDEILEKKVSVFNSYWVADDDQWKPHSVKMLKVDETDKDLWMCLPRTQGGCYVGYISANRFSHFAYVVDNIDGALKITDINLDWGQGLMWPSQK